MQYFYKIMRYDVSMKKTKFYLAIDIGASSGRHIVGHEENGHLMTDEVYRFPNGVKRRGKRLVWDIDALFDNVKKGIKNAFLKYPNIESLSIDTWGVDYVLLTEDGYLSPCISYRDDRTVNAIKRVHGVIPFETLYKKTGIQFQPFNTVYQLYDDLLRKRLSVATDFLMIPEYLNYLLTGVKMKEYTNATTTGLVNSETGSFDREIIDALGLPLHLFGELHTPGTLVGGLKEDIATEVGGQTQVVLCASHDTASAVESLDIVENVPYLSSGTWSLLGIKSSVPHTDADSMNGNWSNEGGVGYVRYQKNIMGLWVVQCLQKELCPELSFGEIAEDARKSDFAGVVDIIDARFLAPESMKAAIDSCFEEDARPKTNSDYFRCAYLSLAHGYKNALEELRHNTGLAFDALYIVGGGAKNTLLNELTEAICNIKVIALPIEATAIGNLKIQIKRGEGNE